MEINVIGVRKDKFIMYPRFLQMMFNARYTELEISGNTLDLKPMGPACFGGLTSKRGTENKFEGLIPLEKFGQFAETEDVAAEPVLVQPAPVNAAPVNAMIAEEHVVQGATEEDPETEILTINSDDEGIEISCNGDDEVELPPEAETSTAISAIQLVITSESLAQLLKSLTEKIGNPPSNPSIQNEEQTSHDPKDPETQPSERILDLKDTTATATATEIVYVFDVDTPRMDVDVMSTEILVAIVVSTPITESTPPVTTAIASSSGIVHEEPCSSSGKRPEV
ncbi:hypothetical protein Hanom_Chr05g00423211 [Helianthus anomalus]